ncbi:MAG: YgjV family protein [Clostridia bacterium]|nr:YgjV family protein [Clostridia bacterium]
MNNIVLGNIISFIGAIFLFGSCIVKTKKRVHFFQLLQCAVFTVSQLVFGRGAGAVSMSVAGVRNLLICFDLYGRAAMLILVSVTAFLGFYFNSAGIVGLLPVAAGIFYSVVSYSAKSIRTLKAGLAVLLLVWTVYSALIFDIFGMISNATALVLNLVTFHRIIKNKER